MPVVNQTGVANGSPGNQYGNSGDHIVDHFPADQRTDWISPAFPLYIYANYKFVGQQLHVACGHDVGFINGEDSVSGYQLAKLTRVYLNRLVAL